MTAICGGGTSAPTVGTSAITLVGSALAGFLLEKYGAAWLKPAIIFLPLPDLTLSTFCATDPPTAVALTAAEANAVLQLNFLSPDWNTGLAKLPNLLATMAWLEFCTCTSGVFTAPAIPPLPQPAGSGVIVAPPAPSSTPCYGPLLIDSLFWNTAVSTSTVSLHAPFLAGATGLLVTAQAQNDTDSPSQNQTWTFTIASVPRQTTRTVVIAVPHDSTVTTWIPVDLWETGISLVVSVPLAGGGRFANWTMAAYCGGALPGVQQSCCPPDAETTFKLDALVRMVTLLQRQLAPFAYVSSTVHAGLTGAGALAVGGLLGVKVAITAFPASGLGQSGTSPTEYFDAGFVSFGTVDGFPTSYRLEHNPQLLFPQLAAAFTSLEYDLTPGVTVTITELLREP
jgi:hypothetical protein